LAVAAATVHPAAPRTLFLGTYPPRECGIATFTQDVVRSYDGAFDSRSGVIAIDEPGADRTYGPSVVARLGQDDRPAYTELAKRIDASDADLVCVQHEYGLFGGEDGAWFLDLLDAIEKPVVVSLHTVLPKPEPAHRDLAAAICRCADAVIVLSQTGKDILVATYGVEASKVSVVHHGVPDVPFRGTSEGKAALNVGDRPIVSTFGLISRGKGLEFGIEAMRDVVDRHPDALYLILGQTHPGVRRFEGESYRDSLRAKTIELGLERNVEFVDRFLDFDELLAYLAATDVYLTPYLNPVQIVSGTLAYAVGIGKAIVSTRYLYAEELLANGRGLLVPFRDAGALGTALGSLLDDPWYRRAIERRAYRFGRQMTWPHVARAYGRIFDSVVAGRHAPALEQPA